MINLIYQSCFNQYSFGLDTHTSKYSGSHERFGNMIFLNAAAGLQVFKKRWWERVNRGIWIFLQAPGSGLGATAVSFHCMLKSLTTSPQTFPSGLHKHKDIMRKRNDDKCSFVGELSL